MKQTNKIAIGVKITSIVLFLAGFVLSVLLGIFFKTSVSSMFQTQDYYNWGVVFVGLWIDFVFSAILFSMGEVIQLLTNQKNVQKYYENSETNVETELPKI